MYIEHYYIHIYTFTHITYVKLTNTVLTTLCIIHGDMLLTILD